MVPLKLKIKKSLALFAFAAFATACFTLLGSEASAAGLAGSIKTTVNDGTGVNVNKFTDPLTVYFYGDGFPDGRYYFQVTTPNNILLSTDNAACREVLVENGVFKGAVGPNCRHMNGTVTPGNSIPVALMPFSPTTNNGGAYKVWMIRQASTTTIDAVDPKIIHFNTNNSKTDNYRIAPAACVPSPDQQCPTEVTLSGTKFYDADADGVKDAGEVGVEGVKIKVTHEFSVEPIVVTTGADGGWSVDGIPANADYTVEEILPETCEPSSYWVQTLPAADSEGNRRYEGTGAGDVTDLDFGNIAFVPATGGRTLGFWSNRNGQTTMQTGAIPVDINPNVYPVFGSNDNVEPPVPGNPAGDQGGMTGDLQFLSRLNLKQNAYTGKRITGITDFDPSTYNPFRTWLLDGSSTNMAMMLSVQLSVSSLNARHRFVGDQQIVDARSVGLGFITVGEVRVWANRSLNNSGVTISGSPHRDSQNQMKNFLDAVNNNLLPFASPVPVGVCYPAEG